MAAADLKTKLSNLDVEQFLGSVENKKRQNDSYQLQELFTSLTTEPPRMWGKTIIGFGSYQYKYATGREGDWFLTGFSPRKQNLTIYIMSGFERYGSLLTKLGKFKTGKCCLYVNKLEDIDINILSELVLKSAKDLKRSELTSL